MKTVFVDVDTQFDFVAPAGALYVPGAEKLAPVLVELTRRATREGIPIISTTDAHAENDPEFARWPPHCVTGTLGQRKPPGTLLEGRIVVPTTPGDYSVAGAQQILIEKQQLDCFTNPNLAAVLDQFAADRYVVYGVVTEYCVRCATLGLLRLGGRVELVTDAIRTLNEADGDRTLREIEEAGGRLTTVAAL